jgi:hypothetical protein
VLYYELWHCTHILHDKSLCLLFKLVRDLYKEPFAAFITIWHHQIQDIVLHGGQKVTRQLAELQGSLSRLMGGAVDWCTALQSGRTRVWFSIGSFRFFFHNSGFARTQEFFQTLMKRSTRHISWGVKSLGAQVQLIYILISWFSAKSGRLNLLESNGHVEACKMKALPYRRVQNSCLSPSIHTGFVNQPASFWALRQK